MRFALSIVSLALIAGTMAHHSPTLDVKPAEALKLLVTGNARFSSDQSTGERRNAERRTAVAKGQKPFAVIVACSDSRVSPELVFDQGLGDLFVIRVAGNTIDASAAGSIEYAVAKLGAKLVFVMGHEHCGAVHAAIAGEVLPGSIPAVVKPILPAVKTARGQKGDLEHNSSVENVRLVEHTMGKIDKLIGSMIKSHQVEVAGGVYDLDTGKIELVK